MRTSLKRVLPLLLGLHLFTLAFGPPKLLESDAGRLPVYPSQVPFILQAASAKSSAKVQLIMDRATGMVVYQRNGYQRVAPASITKIMTAIVALEKGDLKQTVVVKGEDLVGGSVMGLWLGERVALEDLLWGLLLPSGNDAAMATARLVGQGSVARFVDMMNEKAREMGLKDTHFENPHGLDEDDHYSSAQDIATMTRYALDRPLFAQMVATNRHQLVTPRPMIMENSNQLLRRPDVKGVNGVKTGLTDNAGDSLVASVTREGHQVIVVAMGSQSRVDATIPLIDYAFANFTWVPLRPPPSFEADSPTAARRVNYLAPSVMVPIWQQYYIVPRVADGYNSGSGAEAAFYLEGKRLAQAPIN
ncbi:MAG: D-alanyl-D-alanine carboxypeptidase [Chloroflexi bacterium]|nr:D-alanyl-D-alanine carboxypeptidase [Chloroflexota bacterium]